MRSMKKFILSLGLVAMMLNLTNCAKYDDVNSTVEPQGDFEIYASVSRTANDGLNTVWATGDDLGVFHAVTDGTTYTKDGQFKLDDVETSRFLGNVNGTLDPQEEYDWYAMYPYSSYVPGPANTGSGYMTIGCASNGTQTQTGNNSLAHIAGKNYPMVGKAYAVPAGSAPALAMTHAATLLEFEVTNSLEEAITVSSIKFTAPAAIVGTFYLDFEDIEKISATSSGSGYTSKTANLTVKNGTAIAKGETGKFYLPVAPFTAAANAKLAIEVNVTSGEKSGVLAKEITLAAATSFNAGKIKTLKVNYNAEFVEEGLALPFEDNFSWVTSTSTTAYTGITSVFPKKDGAAMYSSVSYVYPETKQVKFGSSSNKGYLTTSDLNLSKPFTVVVSAKCYSSDVSQLQVTAGGVSKTTANLGANYTSYMFEFDALDAAEKVRFDITGKRGYINNIVIVEGHDYVLPPVLTVSPEALTFESPAASQTITCTIANEVDGVNVTATENVDWLTTSVSGKSVTITATENTGANRTANVTIAYEGAESKTVAVTQLAPAPAGGEVVTETLTIYANKGSLSNNVITWTGTNFTFSNAKGSSSTAIRTSDSDHYRIYANSTVTFTAKNGKKFKKLVITCTGSSYTDGLKNALGANATVSGSTVTWTGSAETITGKVTAQSRINKIVATLQ